MTPPATYHDPRLLKAASAHDKVWENPTPIVKSVLGQKHPPGYCTVIDDPDVDGIVIHPEHDYQGLSSAIVLAKSICPLKFQFVMNGDERVYLFCDLTMRVKQWFVAEHAFLLVGEVEGDQSTPA